MRPIGTRQSPNTVMMGCSIFQRVQKPPRKKRVLQQNAGSFDVTVRCRETVVQRAHTHTQKKKTKTYNLKVIVAILTEP